MSLPQRLRQRDNELGDLVNGVEGQHPRLRRWEVLLDAKGPAARSAGRLRAKEALTQRAPPTRVAQLTQERAR